MADLRSPIVSVLGHVDHGKSSILDAVRQTNIISTEAGAITQAIGASIVPMDAIKERSGPLLEKLGMKFTIPGLLFIDTPGHAAFTSLRKRGGAMADIAILVVDINEGFKPQTREAIEILKASKTPFLIAANKVDLVPGYVKKEEYLMKDIASQNEKTRTEVDNRIYEIVGKLHGDFSMPSERYDRVSDYTKQVAIVPCSALKNIGISELLMVVTGMAQRFLEETLHFNADGPAKGSILEVKETKGFGVTVDVIIYDGKLSVNDTIVIGGLDGPIVAKVRALLEPAPLSEMRDKKSDFRNVKQVRAATGVKIAAPGLEDAMAGMPLVGAEDIEKAKEAVQKEIESVQIEEHDEGVIVKADSIGSLEAMLKMLSEEGISVARATVGSINKKDLAAAEGSYEDSPLYGVILGFNVNPVKAPSNIKIITGDIIYSIIDEYKEWVETSKKSMETSQLENIPRPCRLQFLKGYTFRQSNPAVIGVEVLNGVLRTGTALMKEDGTPIGIVRTMQYEQESINEAERGKRIAISIPGATVGRQVNEGDVYLSALSDPNFRKLKELRQYINDDEISVMKEISSIMRKSNPVWGI